MPLKDRSSSGRVQGAERCLRKSACACVSEQALLFTLLGTSSVALGTSIHCFGLWDPHGGYYIKPLHGAGTSQPL